MDEASLFRERFQALTGYEPLSWQSRLFFERFLPGEIPPVCDIPTGLGKTFIIPIWLLAAIRQAENGTLRLPRRLIYIVNRRTVVDQATWVVEQMRARLLNPDDPSWSNHAATLRHLADVLRGLAATDGPCLGVSTLRGELADNEEWKEDPCRLAVIIGTIDMVGSKLLFSGYGDGRYGRAHHAGLVGHDCLWVHDEAHLTPAFGALLRQVAHTQLRQAKDHSLAPFHVLELSATARRRGENAFVLSPEDEKGPIEQERLTASKRLFLHPLGSQDLREKIKGLALEYKDTTSRVLIYVRSPDDAEKIATGLKKALGRDGPERVALLTGTLRGYERDQLLKSPPPNPVAKVVRHFLEGTEPQRSIFLVSTSAGEVGIDLDADHMVCDLAPLDVLIQRLGRVNRRGGKGRDAKVYVVVGEGRKKGPSEFEEAVQATLKILERWQGGSEEGIDVSPSNLRRLVDGLDQKEREEAFSPTPPYPPLTDILLDGWSLTSVQDLPGLPEVSAFLHGYTHDPPETFVCWRREVDLFDDALVSEAELQAWFMACPIEARERLRDRTDRVRGVLRRLLERHRKANQSDTFDLSVVILDERGRAWRRTLSQVVQETEEFLSHKTVVLPVKAGGLNDMGMLYGGEKEPDSKERDVEGVEEAVDRKSQGATESGNRKIDVAEEVEESRRRERWIYRRTGEVEIYERLITGQICEGPPTDLREKFRITLKTSDDEEEGEQVDLILYVSAGPLALEDPETLRVRQELREHTEAVARQMERIAERLGLPEALKEALILAARWHDKGKDRPVWQRYAHNENGSTILAKSDRYLHPRSLGGYRHEFGSLLDASSSPEIEGHPERDLILHLIAAHHGWARPHFEDRAFDKGHTMKDNTDARLEQMRRFSKLQEKYGRYGLAWLESLLRCADLAVSRGVVARKEVQDESKSDLAS